MSSSSIKGEVLVSVVIPAYQEEGRIGRLVHSVLNQASGNVKIEVIVVDDASRDNTSEEALEAGARVLTLEKNPDGGNPAIARNHGARMAKGDPIIFLDSDCFPRSQWLSYILKTHDKGATVVGGALGMPKGLSYSARCDYYCGWYHHHPASPSGETAHHPPGNLSVRRDAFLNTSGFYEKHPIAYAHEELVWQSEVKAKGGKIIFVPESIVDHYNRPGFKNLLRRNYRWGYSAIESKATTGAARFSFLYRYPRFLILASVPLAPTTTLYLISCWIKAGIFEPILMAPVIFMARVAYSLGMAVGGRQWLNRPVGETGSRRPRWE